MVDLDRSKKLLSRDIVAVDLRLADRVTVRQSDAAAAVRDEALKAAEKFQGGGHANAAGAILPKSIRNIPDAVEYIRQVLNPKRDTPLNSLENLFAGIEAAQKK